MLNISTNKNLDPLLAPLPESLTEYSRGLYNCFPTFAPNHGKIPKGYRALAQRISVAIPQGLRVLVVDGYNGVDWHKFQTQLEKSLRELGVETATWLNMQACLAEPKEIRTRIEPFLGGDDPLFGTHFPLGAEVFFDAKRLAEYRIQAAIARGEKAGRLTVIYGCGAGLLELWDQLWYADIPKDLIQIRAKKGLIQNLGEVQSTGSGDFYKRAYFVEWPALNRLKRRLLPELDCFLDFQDSEAPTAMSGEDFRNALHEISETPFRVRPWFLPGPWGGKYMQGHMGLDPDQPNYAWSYELIAPENGIVLEKDQVKLECSFDCLMFLENTRVLGKQAAKQFKYEWPIRLDYLDTMDGGNLSTQCHPRPNYIRKEFGETFTQDETYYIVNAKPGARVYIGLKETCEPGPFQKALEQSIAKGKQIAIDKFVHSEPSKPHDLFLIPNGTVHCSGRNNVVLEISSTPYIFTFKMYDYLRRDLDDKLRPLNISRAFDNIRFERKVKWVRENLLAQPRLLVEGRDWKEFVLYERPESFYKIHRVEFETEYESETKDRGLAINLVAGERIKIIAQNGRHVRLSYLESMVIPAATEKFRVLNKGKRPCKLVIVYVRPTIGITEPLNEPS